MAGRCTWIEINLLCFLCIGAASPRRTNAPQVAAPSGQKTSSADHRLQDAPIEFRCDNMSILSQPNRNVCRQNVVIRRGDLWVCCQYFEGVANEAWQWQHFACHQGVRAQRGADTIWADDAVFFAGSSDLVLSGHPVLQRGSSLLTGERVTIDVHADHAHIERPQGQLRQEPSSAQGPILAEPLQPLVPTSGNLPARCPIAPLLRRPHT